MASGKKGLSNWGGKLIGYWHYLTELRLSQESREALLHLIDEAFLVYLEVIFV